MSFSFEGDISIPVNRLQVWMAQRCGDALDPDEHADLRLVLDTARRRCLVCHPDEPAPLADFPLSDFLEHIKGLAPAHDKANVLLGVPRIQASSVVVSAFISDTPAHRLETAPSAVREWRLQEFGHRPVVLGEDLSEEILTPMLNLASASQPMATFEP